MVFEKEEADNDGPTMERNNQNKENSIDKGPTMERNSQNKEKRSQNKEAAGSCKKENIDNKEDDNDLIVTLAPMEIRAFVLEVCFGCPP